MCVVSMITDHYRDRWPVFTFTELPFTPTQSTPWIQPGLHITLAEWEEYQALKRKAAEYDQRTGQPECEKPDVATWEKAVEDVLRKRGLIAE